MAILMGNITIFKLLFTSNPGNLFLYFNFLVFDRGFQVLLSWKVILGVKLLH